LASKKYIVDILRGTTIYFFDVNYILAVINIIIITNIIKVITIKMMLLTIITLPCNYSHKLNTFLSVYSI